MVGGDHVFRFGGPRLQIRNVNILFIYIYTYTGWSRPCLTTSDVLYRWKAPISCIRKRKERWEKYARRKKLARKKGADEITWKLTTDVSLFDYFLIQLNFIPYRTKKLLCLAHNYLVYCETWEICLVKLRKKCEITRTHLSLLSCFSHFTDISQIVCNQPTKYSNTTFYKWPLLSRLQIIRENSMRRKKHARHDTCVLVTSCYLCCSMRQISHVSHFKQSRGSSGNYARDKGIFSCDKG